LSLPLIIGVSLVTADNWIIAHFASTTSGAVSLMNYAKQLFTAPMAVLAQAAGAASMPFFASLWAQEKRFEFATQVADSVSRVSCLGVLCASAMVSMGLPLVDLIFVGGRFSAIDARECAAYFAIFSVSMFLWSGQAIYARAFYAAGNTFAPMAAGTVITLISLPMYAVLYRWHGALGLAIASDIGIALQTVTIAFLLHKKHMVSLASLDYAELARCAVAALTSGALVWLIFTWLLGVLWRAMGRDLAATSRWVDLVILIMGTALWLGIAKWTLEKAGSMLPRVAMKRLKLG
jgi:putative peptidoglycan lipid II flippase